MNEKTCGTCENWTRTLHNEGVCIMQSVCGDCDDRENLVVTYEADKCGMPADYCECADSLEQWARDMLTFLDNDEGVFCEHCVGNGEGCYGEYLCATMAEARNNFLVRLKALGVKP